METFIIKLKLFLHRKAGKIFRVKFRGRNFTVYPEGEKITVRLDGSEGGSWSRIVFFDEKSGMLEKINVEEDFRRQGVATDLIDLFIMAIAPQIENWAFSGVYPTEEARRFNESIVANHPNKVFSWEESDGPSYWNSTKP